MQKLVDNMVNIDDREKRTRYAHILVELMRQIHPNMKDGQDYYNKLWDDLYIMSNFTLDVDSPYPPPSEEALGKKPQRVPYNTHPLKYKHFGRNIDLLIAKAVSLDDLDEKRAFVSYLTRLMKTFYSAWNKESVEDETIFQSLLDISKGKLIDEITYIRENGLVEATPRERTGDQTQPQRISGGNNYGSGQREGGQGGPRTNNRDGSRNDNSGRQNNARNDRDGGPGSRNNGGPNRNNNQRPNNNNRDGGPRDGGPRDGGPRDGGPRDGGPRNDGSGSGPRNDNSGGQRNFRGDGNNQRPNNNNRNDGPRDGSGPRNNGGSDGPPTNRNNNDRRRR